MTQALGVIHILVSDKYRLSEQPGQCMPTILASRASRSSRLRRRVRDRPAAQHRRSPRTRETGASGPKACMAASLTTLTGRPNAAAKIEPDLSASQVVQFSNRPTVENRAGISDRHHVIHPALGEPLDSGHHPP